MVFCNIIDDILTIMENKVTILILIDGFLQSIKQVTLDIFYRDVTILILIDGFLQYGQEVVKKSNINVTILILIDGFLQ